jgi:DegV family protein with EDD domain
MVKIVIDSTCELPAEILDQYDIRVAPISIQFGQDTFEEGINISHDDFYGRIERSGKIPTTAQPTPAWFAKHYRDLKNEGHSILTITITSKHSGTFESAVIAKEIVPEADVEVFDSRSISMGTGWMVLEAAREFMEGKTRSEVVARLREMRERMSIFFTPATLKYLQMSGRVSRLQFALGSILDLKPVVEVKEGLLDVCENVRTRGKAVGRLLELTAEKVGTSAPTNLAVFHARSQEEAQKLLEQAKEKLNCKETLVGEMAMSLAVHGGPGILGVIAYPAKE